ncbi:MAG: hypothetical protein SFU91_11995 [Chloroherpetonaceae bacterium]|nr:hypothetical protein [Chloroherpetonaceae bacterium]
MRNTAIFISISILSFFILFVITRKSNFFENAFNNSQHKESYTEIITRDSINSIEKSIIKNENYIERESSNEFSNPKFIIKTVISFILLLASLFVILSKKYDETKEKWAIDVLVLISGLWLGSL